MARSKVWLSLVILILTTALLLAGCTSSKSPLDNLKVSMAKSAEMKTYSFTGSIKMEELTVPSDTADPTGLIGALKMLKGADISWSGVYRAEPMHAEITMSIATKGDVAVNVNVPIIIEKDKLWVRIPNIPTVPIPENLVGKFAEIDIKKLGEQSGQTLPNMDPGKTQQMMNDILGIILKHVDEKQYLSDVSVKDAGLPGDSDAKKVVRLAVHKDQVEPFVNTAVDKIAPEVLDLMSKNEEYRNLLGLNQEKLDQITKDLSHKEDINKRLEQFKKNVKTFELTSDTGINDKDFPVYSGVHFKTEMDEQGKPVSVAFNIISQYKDINKEVKFEYPDGPKEIVPLEQLLPQLLPLFMGLHAAGQGM